MRSGKEVIKLIICVCIFLYAHGCICRRVNIIPVKLLEVIANWANLFSSRS